MNNPNNHTANASARPLDIIYQEPEFLVINKPSGLLAVPGRAPELIDSVTHRVILEFPHSIKHPAVHRLDMDTSGLMLLALTPQTHRALSIQFEKRVVHKQYIALLEGILHEDQGEIELPFRLDPTNRPYQIHDPVHGKIGRTIWRKITTEPPWTRVEFIPLTGRTHQLRLHAAHRLGLGIPIVGDTLYGNGQSHGEMKLHATYLSFFHPHTGTPLTFRSPSPF